VNQSENPDMYRLDSTITRAEVVGTALKLAGVNLPSDYRCENYYLDVAYNPVNNWVCRAVEIAADREVVSKSNNHFRPQDQITKSEVLAIMTDALCIR